MDLGTREHRLFAFVLLVRACMLYPKHASGGLRIQPLGSVTIAAASCAASACRPEQPLPLVQVASCAGVDLSRADGRTSLLEETAQQHSAPLPAGRPNLLASPLPLRTQNAHTRMNTFV